LLKHILFFNNTCIVEVYNLIGAIFYQVLWLCFF